MDDDDSPPAKRQAPRVLKVLEALKQAFLDLRSHPDSDDPNSPAVKALLELETESDTFLSTDPNLAALSALLARLRSLLDSLRRSRAAPGLLAPFVARRLSTHSISRVADSIGAEIQAWIDRECVEGLTRGLREKPTSEDEFVTLLTHFELRLAAGFDRELQDLVLKSKLFTLLESALRDSPGRTLMVRERCSRLIGALIRFNKDVFVGQVLMGPTIKSLIAMSTACSMKVLCDLIRSIKSPLVDEIEIPKIVSLLASRDAEMRAIAHQCVNEIGYFGRKEAIDAMLGEGLVERLVELQRAEVREVYVGAVSSGRGMGAGVSPFASCVARFAVSLEIGEGLRQREKRALKQEILGRVREACVGDADEGATILAEVLWGSSP